MPTAPVYWFLLIMFGLLTAATVREYLRTKQIRFVFAAILCIIGACYVVSAIASGD